MTQSSLDMMQDSLNKKISVMNKIHEENQTQKEILENPQQVDGEAFDAAVERKAALIDELNILNDGFQGIYDRIKEDLLDNKDQYKEQILILQDQIREITSLSSQLEQEEQRNKEMADAYFSTERSKLKTGVQSSKAALDYYQNMNKVGMNLSLFFDSKN